MKTKNRIGIAGASAALALALLCAGGCSKNTTRSAEGVTGADARVRTAALGDTVAVRRGESVMFGDEILLTFSRVPQDSRCPEDVTCVWAGNARVELALRKSGGALVPVVLNTGMAPRDTTIDRYAVALHALSPTPNTHRVIEPDEYVASVSVRIR